MNAPGAIGNWNRAVYEDIDNRKAEVRKWRRTLQVNFLERRQFRPEDMAMFHYFFMRIESYEMTTEELKVSEEELCSLAERVRVTFSKIRKVAKLIAILPDGEKPTCDDVYHFRDRARELARRWRPLQYAEQIADGMLMDTVNSDDELAGHLASVSICEES